MHLDLLAGTAPENFKVNFRKGWYANVESVTVKGDHEAVFNLKEPQPALLALLASGFTPVYPCHVPPAKMRQAPIGTGPFKFVEYKANQTIKVAKNPTYWKKGLPISTASNTPSSPTARRRSCPSSPASTTSPFLSR